MKQSPAFHPPTLAHSYLLLRVADRPDELHRFYAAPLRQPSVRPSQLE
jgi:hypothetical protein